MSSRRRALGVGHTVAWCFPTAGILIRDGTPTHMLSEPFAARRSELQFTVTCDTGCEQRRPQGRSRASISSNFVLTLDGIQDACQQQLACCSCARTCLPAVVYGDSEVLALAMRCLHITAHTLRAPPSSVQFCRLLGERLLAPVSDEKKHEAIAAARPAEATAGT